MVNTQGYFSLADRVPDTTSWYIERAWLSWRYLERGSCCGCQDAALQGGWGGGLGYRRSNLSDICNSESRDIVRWYGTTIGSMTGIIWSDEGQGVLIGGI